MINMEKDATNSTGGWNKIAYVRKLTDAPQIHSGYVDRVTINWIVDDIDGADTLRSSFPFGVMFAASYEADLETVDGEANQLSPDHIVDITARNGGGGTATLYLRRKIVQNQESVNLHDGYLYLWVKNTDLTPDDNVIMRYYIETFGRWVETADV